MFRNFVKSVQRFKPAPKFHFYSFITPSYPSLLHKTLTMLPYSFKKFSTQESQQPEVSPELVKLYKDFQQLKSNTKYPESLKIAYQALDLSIVQLGYDHLSTIFLLKSIGNLQVILGQHDKAIGSLTEALNLSTKLNEPEISIARLYKSIATARSGQWNYDESLAVYLKALSIIEMIPNTEVETASLLNDMSYVLKTMKRYDEASKYQARSLDILLKKFGDQNKNATLARTYMNIGLSLFSQGKSEESIKNHMNALKYDDGSVMTFTANLHYNIGLTYKYLSKFDEALEHQFKSLQMREAMFGEVHPYIMDTYHQIGDNYELKGDYAKSLEYHDKGLDLLVKLKDLDPYKVKARTQMIMLSGNDKQDAVRAYLSFAETYEGVEHHHQACLFYLKARKILIGLYGEDHAEVTKVNERYQKCAAKPKY